MSAERRSILVVEDDPSQRLLLEEFLRARGYTTVAAASAEEALQRISEKIPALVLMDVKMPGMGGLEGLVQIRARIPALAVILLTAHADLRDAVHSIHAGAIDYLEKPLDLDELAAAIADAIGVDSPTEASTTEIPPLPPGFIVASEAMRRVIREADLVAPTEATVLVTGESGTGKEKLAEFLHQRSRRSAAPLVRMNCAAIPQALVESELFGHVRGAFTGADGDRQGRFEAAAGGTILLDEVGELPLEVQPKLLRVLEDGSYERLGESRSCRVDVRVIAATNRDLEKEVAAGRFREDLFWRLNVFRLHIPPLRERRDAIPALARALLAASQGRRVRLSPAAARRLEAHSWPGNIRELANVVVRSAILATGGVILPEQLPEALGAHPGDLDENGEEPVLTMRAAERRAIRDALQRCQGNRTQAAKLLGISRRTLVYRLKEYGGDP